MAEAARIAAGEGADIIDINMGCPAKKVTGGYAGSALMREPGPRAVADRRGDRRCRRAGDGEDAARLGRKRAERAAAGAPRRAGRRQDGDGSRPHPLPVLSGQGRLACHCQGKAGRIGPGRRQWRRDLCGRCSTCPRAVRRRRGNGRPRAATARRGPRRKSSSRREARWREMCRQAPKTSRTTWLPITRRCCRFTGSKAGSGMRASISAGTWTFSGQPLGRLPQGDHDGRWSRAA